MEKNELKTGRLYLYFEDGDWFIIKPQATGDHLKYNMSATDDVNYERTAADRAIGLGVQIHVPVGEEGLPESEPGHFKRLKRRVMGQCELTAFGYAHGGLRFAFGWALLATMLGIPFGLLLAVFLQMRPPTIATPFECAGAVLCIIALAGTWLYAKLQFMALTIIATGVVTAVAFYAALLSS